MLLLLLKPNPMPAAFALMLFCRLMSGRVSSMLGRLLWSRGAATPETLVFAVLARLSLMLRAERVERFELLRCRRVVVGMMVVLVPVVVYGSLDEKKWSDVEEAVDATEAVCARRADSSRVRRFTLDAYQLDRV
jgi:hypothetical protein